MEYIDKINSENIIPLNSQKELNDFSSNYGDISFLYVDQGELDEYALNEDDKNMKMKMLKCYEEIAEYYKPIFYFGYMDKNKFRNYYDIKLPAIIVILIFLIIKIILKEKLIRNILLIDLNKHKKELRFK